MRRFHREGIIPLALLLGIGGVLPVGLLLAVGRHMVMFGMAAHISSASASARSARQSSRSP